MKKSERIRERILSVLQLVLTAIVSCGMLLFILSLDAVIHPMIDWSRLSMVGGWTLSLLIIIVLVLGAWQTAIVVARNNWRQVEIYWRVWQKARACHERYWLYPEHLRKDMRKNYEDRHSNMTFAFTILFSWSLTVLLLNLERGLPPSLAMVMHQSIVGLGWFYWLITLAVLAVEGILISFFGLSTALIARHNNRLRRKMEKFDR